MSVQANDHALAAVERALPNRLAAHDRRRAATTVSVRIEPPVERGPQPMHLVYVNGCLHLRTRDDERALRTVQAIVSAPSMRDVTDQLVLDGVGVVGADGAAVLPSGIRSHVAAVERRLNQRGLRVLDEPYVLVEPTTGALVPDASGTTRRIRGWLLEDLAGANDPLRQPGVDLVVNLDALRTWRARAILTRVESGARLQRVWDPWPDDLPAAIATLATGRS